MGNKKKNHCGSSSAEESSSLHKRGGAAHTLVPFMLSQQEDMTRTQWIQLRLLQITHTHTNFSKFFKILTLQGMTMRFQTKSVRSSYLKHQNHQRAPAWLLPVQQVQEVLGRQGIPENQSPTPAGHSAPERRPGMEPGLGQRWEPAWETSDLRDNRYKGSGGSYVLSLQLIHEKIWSDLLH